MPAIKRDNPYGAFKFRVEFGDVDGNKILAGFSDVSGLGTEINYSEYREGTDGPNTVRKIPNTFKLDEVTLKRGLIGSTDIFAWIKAVNEGRYQPRPVTIVVLDEVGDEALTIVLTKAQPKKWTGPTLAGKGGGDVATEEMKIVHEGLEYR
jgi:phage tail-like protein